MCFRFGSGYLAYLAVGAAAGGVVGACGALRALAGTFGRHVGGCWWGLECLLWEKSCNGNCELCLMQKVWRGLGAESQGSEQGQGGISILRSIT